MPKGPKGEKRPGDGIAAAIMVAKIATGEVKESNRHLAKSKLKPATPVPDLGTMDESELAELRARKKAGPKRSPHTPGKRGSAASK
jgi:hypothetical protein